jgi:tRNA threonylcarbamoyladenosine modification (KEOPS) complex  Pcc1 subunit
MSKNNYEAKITIEKISKINYGKVLGDIREHKRSGMSIKETPNTLEIHIKTSDITALRASINNIIRDLQVVESAQKV